MDLVLLLVVATLIILPVIVAAYSAAMHYKGLLKKEHEEDRKEVYRDLPRPVRRLHPDEVKYLTEKQDSLIIPLAGRLIIIICVVPLVLSILSGFIVAYFSIGLLAFAPFLFSLLLTSPFIILLFLRRNYYLDLRSPVFGITGKSLYIRNQQDKINAVFIRSMGFGATDKPYFFPSLESTPEGTDLYIEYSPHSKKVWKIEPV